jgi:hypothetical protein
MKMQERKVAETPDARLELVGEGMASLAEARAFLKLGHSKLYGLMGDGSLAYAQFGRIRRIPWRALREFAARALVSA